MPGDLKLLVSPPFIYSPNGRGQVPGRSLGSVAGGSGGSGSPALSRFLRTCKGRGLGCTTASIGSALLPVTASCSTTSACHYLYFPAVPALLPLRAPPPKVMTSALWNEEWVILEKQLSLDRWQQELGCFIAQFPGAATKSLELSVFLCCQAQGQATG